MSLFKIGPKIYGAWQLKNDINLFDQMAEPIRRRLNYQNVIRNIIRVDPLLQDNKVFIFDSNRINKIQAFLSDGFQVGTTDDVNRSESEESQFNIVRDILGDVVDVNVTVRSKLMNTILESVDDVLECEDEIVGIHKTGKYNRYGRNGCLMAIRKFCDDSSMIISDDVDLDKVVDSIFWV